MKIGKIHVCILWQMEKQGFYEFDRAPRLLEAIASAWGFVEKSSKKNVFVIRAGEAEPCLKLDLGKYLRGETTGHHGDGNNKNQRHDKRQLRKRA